MNRIDTLIAYLFSIQAFAKDIHYSAKGEAFYSKHLLADEIYKGIDEHIDSLIETCILPFDESYRIFNFWEAAIIKIRNKEISFESLRELIVETLEYIDKTNGSSQGEQALIDNVAQDLQRKLGLITRQVDNG
jgi:DNA-binding ferritin-like protein